VCKQISISSVVVASDLVLEVSEEASLGLLPLTMLIDDPFLIFEELAVLDESLMDIGLAMGTSSTVSMCMTFGASVDMSSCLNMSTCVNMTFSVSMSVGCIVNMGLSMRMRMAFSVNMRVALSMNMSVSVSTFADHVSLFDDFSDNRLGMGGLNDGLVVNLCPDFSLLLAASVNVSLMHDGHVLLLNKGGVLLVDHWLMVLVDVLLNHDWLMMLMNNVLMMLMNYIFLVLNNNILVMLVDHILMDFFHDGCIGVLPVLFSQLVPVNSLTFIGALVDCLLVVSDHNWFLIYLFNMSIPMALVELS